MMNDRKDKNLDSMEASSPVTRPRESLQGQCQHCHDKSHLTSEPVFESPFKGMSRILLAFKSVGIFNFTIHDDFTEFECNPHLIFYALFLNLLVLAIPIGLQVMWIVYLPQGVTYEVILEKVNQSFSSTDFVAVVGLLALIQLSSLWLQLTNISACGNLNDLVNGVRALGVVDGYDGVIQNPKCTKQTYLFLLIAMIIVSFTLIIVLYSLTETQVVGCPQNRASFISYLTLSWLNDLIRQGFRAPLTQEQLPKVDPGLDSSLNELDFLNNWNKEFARNGQVNIWRVLFRTHWKALALAMFLYLIHHGLHFVNPLMLKLILNHLQTPDEETWKGVLFASVTFITSILFTILFNIPNQLMTGLAVKLRNGLVTAIYKKSLRLSNEARQEFSSGEIINFSSVDSQLILECVPYVEHLIADPLLVIVTMTFLYLELGPAALAGVVFLFLLVPFNTYGNRKIEKCQDILLKNKDERMKITSETLNGIQLIKMYCWEIPFMNKIKGYRNIEVDTLQSTAKLYALSNCTFSSSPVFASLLIFVLYVALDPANHVLNPEKIFVSISLLSILRIPLELFPIVLFDTIRIGVSIRRIGKFLNAEELDEEAVGYQTEDPKNAIEIKDGSFAWSKDGDFSLETGTVSILKGSLVAIVGKVGCGKSSLLSCLLGDMVKRRGSVNIDGQIAYIPQDGWILNTTLKENILFGKSMQVRNYERVISASALEQDFSIMAHGDQTEIGENGINLSGGQKQRVSIARAVFANRDVYLLDDPLSAVDSHVGEHIFHNVISSGHGLLRDKTRVLVTNQIHFLEKMDQIIVIDQGQIKEQGTYQELLTGGKQFATLIRDFGQRKTHEKVRQRQRLLSHMSNGGGEDYQVEDTNVIQDAGSRLIRDEEAFHGQVRWSVYLDYMRIIGRFPSTMILVMFVLGQGLHVSSTAWLSYWADMNDGLNHAPILFLGVYGLIGVSELFVCFGRQYSLYRACAKASRALHHKLLYHIIRAPMSFFDTTPLGRILNRFSSDLDVADETLPQEFTDFLWCFMDISFTLILIAIATPWFIIVALGLFVMFCLIILYYIRTSRQLKRLESISKSPILSHISETLRGVSSLRAYHCADQFVSKCHDKLNENVACHYLNACSVFWLGARTEFIGALIIFSVALLVVLDRGSISAGLAGMVLTYSFELLEAFSWMVNMACNLEGNSVCLERIMEYYHVEQEDQWTKPGNNSECRGALEFQGYSTRYRPGLDLCLQRVSLKIQPQEKLGICGRTGAGKSSFTKALFRIVEPVEGKILLDGIDITEKGLHDLRGQITIIPQDPILFSGSLRFNLDPLEQHSDQELWSALEHSHLIEYVNTLRDGLEHQVHENGDNFSVGQRQLVCLARALLRNTKILILDEATASVDLETDALIQRTIREKLNQSTIVTIAHRINTILDSDRILVLSDGSVAELDSPHSLSSVIPEILGLSIDRLFDLVFGFAIAIAICYLHLPQLLSEFLFLRFMTVLEYHFEHLLGHIDCCMVHKGAFMVKPDRLKQTACCLDHCNGLIKLHRTIEETFSRQLLILFGLIMGSLIFSLYLSITFIISYKSWFHGLFIIGCFVFSLVPAGRLYFLGSSVNQVIKKVSEVKQRLYMIESFSTRELDVQGKVRCTIRKYSEITGFSADNYFVVNNAMFTSILGYLTTYLIVLVQFKIAERSHA
ncbi:hypothetical protein TCAL_05777 [Tigriopus californicus]|uniref:Uncharacterized protein n=1 Tax=Tigriopus californicus TaxID=6832 RepID=A0A553NCS2_TIGCA|nr:hypothetical protein TCAL_05777 [Tigriopus californicus]